MGSLWWPRPRSCTQSQLPSRLLLLSKRCLCLRRARPPKRLCPKSPSTAPRSISSQPSLLSQLLPPPPTLPPVQCSVISTRPCPPLPRPRATSLTKTTHWPTHMECPPPLSRRRWIHFPTHGPPLLRRRQSCHLLPSPPPVVRHPHLLLLVVSPRMLGLTLETGSAGCRS